MSHQQEYFIYRTEEKAWGEKGEKKSFENVVNATFLLKHQL